MGLIVLGKIYTTYQHIWTEMKNPTSLALLAPLRVKWTFVSLTPGSEINILCQPENWAAISFEEVYFLVWSENYNSLSSNQSRYDLLQ